MNGCVTSVDPKNFNQFLCEFQQLFQELMLDSLENATCLGSTLSSHVWDFEDKKMDNDIR